MIGQNDIDFNDNRRDIDNVLQQKNTSSLSSVQFYDLLKMLPRSAIEIIPFRKNNSLNEVLLLPRSHDDPYWPNMYHIPGTILRNEDFHRSDTNPLQGAFERIEAEINFPFSTQPQFMGIDFNTSERGSCISIVFLSILDNEAKVREEGKWESITDLANDNIFIQTQLPFINKALKALETGSIFIDRNFFPITR